MCNEESYYKQSSGKKTKSNAEPSSKRNSSWKLLVENQSGTERTESVTMTQLLRNHVERTTFCVRNLVYRHFSCISGRRFWFHYESTLYWTCTPSYAEVQAQKRMTGPYQHTQKVFYTGVCALDKQCFQSSCVKSGVQCPSRFWLVEQRTENPL